MRVLVLDNYDSFTYNLVQYLGELGADVEVVRNDHATVDELLVRGYDRVIVSPGPCTPNEAGISLEAVERFPQAKVPTLGVCLGHQALVQAWGGKVIQHEPVHGKTTTIEHDGQTIFRGLRQPLEVGRYHSLVADPDLPDCLTTSARGGDVVMAVRHRELPAEGVQFHPESVLTEQGRELLANFLAHSMTAGPDLLTRAIDTLAGGQDLGLEDTAAVLREIMAGNASEIQIAAFLIALRTKGETVEELAGLARTMRAMAARVAVSSNDLLDTAGTGGGRRTFNVSTTAALIAAGAGCTVAKHGNRSATGLSGSADVLEALGARIDLGPEQVARCIDEVGFGFMFAPAHHQATRYVVPVRRELAVRTIFNFLGPLTNPAGATRQLIGVSDPGYLETMAGALALLGTKHALLVSSDDGLDELSISAPTQVVEVIGATVTRYAVAPEDVGLRRAPAQEIPGGDPAQNAETAQAIFAGQPGAARDLAALNAGAAIYAGGGADTLADGVRAAERAIDAGAAAAALERFVRRTNELAPVKT